jgi:hypothetical protein
MDELNWVWVEFYITTDGQPANLSWNKAPIWGLRPDLYYCLQVAGCWFAALSLTRGRVCRLLLLLALTSAVFLESESLGTRDHIFLSQIWDFPFRRLLRLAGSRWKYSTPPPHGFRMNWIQVKFRVTLRLTVSQSVTLGVEAHLGLVARYLLIFDSYGLVFVRRPLWREDGSVVYNGIWPSPTQ